MNRIIETPVGILQEGTYVSPPTPLSVDRIAKELNLKICNHAMDGGILKTFADYIDWHQDVYEQAIERIKTMNPVGIWQANFTDFFSPDGKITGRRLLVRLLPQAEDIVGNNKQHE